MQKRLVFLLLSPFLLSNIFGQQQHNIYISTTGSDANVGSINKPLATLEKARKHIRNLKDKNKNSGTITVYLRGGEYFLDSTFVLYPEDSGNHGNSIIYSSYPGEKAVLIGGRQIKGWKTLNESPEISTAARDKIWVADVPGGWLFHYLFVDGKLAIRSQSDHRFWRQWNKDHKPGKPDSNGQLISFSDKQQLKYLPSNGDAEMVCIMAQYGVMGNGVISDVDTAKGTLRWNSHQVNITGSRDSHERGYRFENALCMIDRPGEWAVNSKAGKLYYFPKENEDINSIRVIAPRLYELIRLQGDENSQRYVQYIELRNLELRYTDRLPEDQWLYTTLMRQWENIDAAIFLTGTMNCSITGNKILYSGAYGITLNHFNQQNSINGNEIGFTGSGGIFLEGYGPGTMDVNKFNTITANYIHDHGLGNYWHSPSIQIYQSGNNTISYNLLQRSAYSAISTVGIDPGRMSDSTFYTPGNFEGQVQKWNMAQIRFEDFDPGIREGLRNGNFKFDRETMKPYLHSNNNSITYNIISEPHSLLNEGGAIYEWCSGKGNLWKNNVIFKSRGMPGSSVLALDDLAEYTTVENNCFWVEGTILNGVGSRKTERGNIISNNYRVNYKTRFAATASLDKIGVWWMNEPGREKMDELVKIITNNVRKKGGWPGNSGIGIPGIGEEITKYGESDDLPKDSHVTIEEK
ncbi:right-handed parallel beta-helix repeat-containing protein [Flavitalea sp.]|nr:right-handed parallel beta-helix repeat-containing protein [Flavitalea sp.]